MKMLLANTRDIVGGAAIAAYRIHKGLREKGIDSSMLVDIKNSDDDSVIKVPGSNKWRSRIDHLPVRLFKNKARSFSMVKGPALETIGDIDPDLVHLHWINNGFISIEQIAQIKQPIVWTLHDMWAFSDSRHYSLESDFPDYCSNQLLDKWVWKRKRKAYQNLDNVHIVTPSRWLAGCAGKSSLLRDKPIHVIANGVDTEFYKPGNKHSLKQRFQIDPQKRILLFSGYNAVSDERKGFNYLIQAIKQIDSSILDQILLAVVGSEKTAELENLAIPVRYFGKINDQSKMRDIYAMADLFVLPSLQDNLPNTVVEAMACGNSVVAFNIGGIPDMIDHMQNGYLAQARNAQDLANGIKWFFSNTEGSHLSNQARQKVLNDFDIANQSEKYIALYESIIG